MLQVITIIQGLVGLLGVAGVSPTNVAAIQAALSKATGLLAAFQGLTPPTSIDADVQDLYVLVGAIEATGLVPDANEHFADVQAIITKFKSVESDLDQGDFALFFKFARTNSITGAKAVVDVGGYEEGGRFAQTQLGA